MSVSSKGRVGVSPARVVWGWGVTKGGVVGDGKFLKLESFSSWKVSQAGKFLKFGTYSLGLIGSKNSERLGPNEDFCLYISLRVMSPKDFVLK
jgi:hypothetical protein